MSGNNRSETRLHVYSIEKPAWHQVTEEQKEQIANFITNGGWQIVDDKRKGFLNCEQTNNIVYGYYAQEGELKIEQFDDEQRPTEEEQQSFERLLFLLLLDAGILIVQSVRISRYIDLTGPTVRQSLFDALELVFRQVDLTFQNSVDFERYRLEYTKEELHEIYRDNNIERLIVTDLLHSDVPPDVKLFNPDFDANEFLKSVIEEDLHFSEEVEWQGQDIQQTKIATGLLYAGNPQLLAGYETDGSFREWRQSDPQSLIMELDTEAIHFPEDDLARLIEALQRRFALFRERLEQLQQRQDTDDLPLFDNE